MADRSGRRSVARWAKQWVALLESYSAELLDVWLESEMDKSSETSSAR